MTPEQQEIADLKAKLKAMSDELESVKKEKDKEIATLKKENEEIGLGINAADHIVPVLLQVVLECFEVLKQKYPNDVKARQEVFDEILVAVQKQSRYMCNDRFFKRWIKKGSEKLSTQRLAAQIYYSNELKPKQRSIQERDKKVDSTIDVTGQAIINMVEQAADAGMQAAANLVNYANPVINDEAVNRLKSLGRQAVPVVKSSAEHGAYNRTWTCRCGCEELDEGEEQAYPLRTIKDVLGKFVEMHVAKYKYAQCRKCKHVNFFALDDDVPVTPGASLGQKAAVSAAMLYAQGMPLNRAQSTLFGFDSKLGNETLGRNIKTMCDDTFAKMTDALRSEMKHQHTLIADETTLKILESQGKGIGKNKPEKTRQTDYIGAVCSTSHEEHPCVIFEHLGGRTNEAIHKMLDGFTPVVLMSDAYASYDSYCDKHEGIKHQNCIAHLRRELLDAIDLDKLTKSLAADTVEEAIEKATKQAEKDPTIFQLCCVLKGIGKVYGYEKTVKKEKDESREDYLQRVLNNRIEHAKPLMDDVDIVMKSLAEKHKLTDENGSVKANRNLGQLGKAIVYYMNRRDKLRLFLTDPEVPLDSNAVERCVRAVAVLRKACDFKQTVEHTRALCVLMSLKETALANGIHSPATWLSDFARAVFIHRAEKTLTRQVRYEGRSLEHKLMKFDEDADNGFDITPWLPWNYVKAHPEVTQHYDDEV